MQREIEDQMELGAKHMGEQNTYLLEINLCDLDCSSGEDKHYWLRAIQAARESQTLRASSSGIRAVTPLGDVKCRAGKYVSKTKYFWFSGGKDHQRSLVPRNNSGRREHTLPRGPDCNAVQLYTFSA